MRYTFNSNRDFLVNHGHPVVANNKFIADVFHSTGFTNKTSHNATLEQVLHIAGLSKAYADYQVMFKQAELLFKAKNNRAALDVLYKIWISPDIVPALLLSECYYARKLIVPNWHSFCIMHYVLKDKPCGGTRPIIIPDKETRICMGVINSLFQASCASWNDRTYGFRLGTNTAKAMLDLCRKTRNLSKANHSIVLVSFDISGAFNAVNVQHAFQVLCLKNLPHAIKTLIWKWQKTMPSNIIIPGLKQGVPYSPTLFAWYLDYILVQHTEFFCYADNCAGVFPSMQHADAAISKAIHILSSNGMKIKNGSLYKQEISNFEAKRSVDFNWLGHIMLLPSPKVILNKPITRKHTLDSIKVITKHQWATMLNEQLWLIQVRAKDWRNFS